MNAPHVDLLVLGGGMAGLTAAARAARDGLSVLVVESGGAAGGNARYAGYAWTAPNQQSMAQVNPDGDPALRAALVERFADGIAWIRSVGVTCHEPVPILGYGLGHQFDTNHYLDTCLASVVGDGGEVLLRARAGALVQDGGGVTGATLLLADGSERRVTATSTLLATGGFQADPELLTAHVHPRATEMPLRSGATSDGGGYRLATAVGASTGADDAGFYGHLVPSGVPFRDSADYVDLSLYYSEHALLFNLEGERFVDETLGDHLTTMALLEQPEGRGLLVCDARVMRDWVLGSYVEGAVAVDKFALATRRSGRTGVAEELDELAYLPEDWGYDGTAIAAAIRSHNTAARAGVTTDPPRALDGSALDEGPWYVIECVPAITFPFHGVRIDDRARVLRADGTPVPGLLCAGSDTGGLYVRAYAGGLASALVFGLAAATTAAAAAGSRSTV